MKPIYAFYSVFGAAASSVAGLASSAGVLVVVGVGGNKVVGRGNGFVPPGMVNAGMVGIAGIFGSGILGNTPGNPAVGGMLIIPAGGVTVPFGQPASGDENMGRLDKSTGVTGMDGAEGIGNPAARFAGDVLDKPCEG